MDHALLAIHEPEAGDKWRAVYARLEQGYRRWFLKEGDAARPRYLTGVRALRRFMPELLPTYERLVDLAGGGDVAARLLSLYRPTPYLTGCSQAVWLRDRAFLVRNYDYSPRLWDGILLHSRWMGRTVMAMLDSLWGVLDGVNDAGLSVSLAFGGRRVVGDGFGMPLILRYVLETCESAADAQAVLSRVPTHMSYNVTVLDAAGTHFTAFLAPDREPYVSRVRYATNHQRGVEWHAYAAATGTLSRERLLAAHVEDAAESPKRFVERFLEPPLYSSRFRHGWGTLYTAAYHPAARRAELRWPGTCVTQSIDRFDEMNVHITFRDA